MAAEAQAQVDAIDVEKTRLAKLREVQAGNPIFAKLQPASLKGIKWKDAKQVTLVADAGVAIVELPENQAVVISGNTHNAVHAVTARGILQTMKIKHLPSKIMQPLQHAEWDEMIRNVVRVADAAQAAELIEFLTGKAISLDDFNVTSSSAWKREVLIVSELNTACEQPLLTDGAGALEEFQLEDIGKLMAVDLLFNNTRMLGEQIGVVKTPDGGIVTSVVQQVNAEPDGLNRNKYMGFLGELLEFVFTEAKQEQAIEELRKTFSWGDAQLTNQQMGHVLNGLRAGLKLITEKAWTKESLTKLINKTFRNVKEEVGTSKVDEIMDFLQVVQEEIADTVEGRTTVIGMCGTKSVISIAVDY